VRPARAVDITIEGTSPSATNCVPFGGPPPGYAGFIYKNIPAFALAAGDVLAFDTLFQNEQPIVVDIALATAASNGSHVPDANGFTTIAQSATPASPTGDSVLGNYDLAFTASVPFTFTGGGLIIRVLPVGSYATDMECSAGLVHYLASDPADFFVGRFLTDANGAYPWQYEDAQHIGGFRLSIAGSDCGDGDLDGSEECDDGNVFDGDCCSGTCDFDAPGASCTDNNPCTDDACNGAGVCVHTNNTAPCDDDLFCTGADTCAGGTCSVHAGDPCAGGLECNNTCNEAFNECLASFGTPCTDDGNQCTTDTCDGNGTCVHDVHTGSCDDGVFCNGADSCSAGACTQHAGDPCAGGAACATACDEANDVCADPPGTPCDDGLFCNGDDTCLGGTCGTHEGDPCAGGAECNATCDEAADDCVAPAGTPCTGDGNPCTDDQCNGSGTCLHPDNTAPCDDGLFCNGADTCAAGACTGHPGDPCVGGAECATVCDETNDVCADPTGTPCADEGNPCTDETCDGAGSCAHTPNQAACDDGVFCNGADTCAGGACGHAGNPCAGGGECADTCDEATDSCFEPAGTPCADDGDLCSSEACDGAGSCRHAFVPAFSCERPIAPRAALLSMQSGSTQQLSWVWRKGAATTKAAFGDPTQTTAYALCIYERESDILSLALTSEVRSGGTCGRKPCWKETPTGFEYSYKRPRRAGQDKVKMKAGKKAGKTSILVRRSGEGVTLPSLPLRSNATVTVQLRSSEGACWGADYSSAARNDATHFKATSD
jgi:hypothetical protein